jgi:hypothetical protein
MIRFVAFAVGIVLVAWLVVRLARAARGGTVDWRSIGLICLFVVLAFWLRDATGIG